MTSRGLGVSPSARGLVGRRKRNVYGVLLPALGIGLVFLAWAVWLILPFGPSDEVRVHVERGLASSAIGRLLADRGLIKSASLFQVATRIAGVEGKLKAGSYRLSARMGTFGIIRTLAEGGVERVRFTVPEGYTVNEVANLLDGKGLVSGERFLSLASGEVDGFCIREGGFEFSGDLEGYLFPDTYEVEFGAPEEAVIACMVRRFAEVVLREWSRDDVDDRAKALGFRGALIIASIVEREARLPGERPLIAAVFYNRLSLGMPLQSCATVQFALGAWKEHLSYDDLKVDSPYNTYLVSGLPPGPIASPGLASISAAFHPTSSDHLFFAADGKGGHMFSRTFHEHQKALALMRLRD